MEGTSDDTTRSPRAGSYDFSLPPLPLGKRSSTRPTTTFSTLPVDAIPLSSRPPNPLPAPPVF